MYLSRMVEHPNDYLVYGRAAAKAYVDGRDDATPEDIALRPWKAEWPHYIRVHNAEFIAGTVANGISATQRPAAPTSSSRPTVCSSRPGCTIRQPANSSASEPRSTITGARAHSRAPW